MKPHTLPEIDHFSELIGEFIEFWGFKKIHGKIWTHIFLSQQPIDAKELMKLLKISKALVSITIKDLLIYEVIFEGPTSQDGTRTYVANKDVRYVIQRVLRTREKVLMGKIKITLDNIKSMTPAEYSNHNIDSQKVKDIDKLIKKGEQMLSAIMTILK